MKFWEGKGIREGMSTKERTCQESMTGAWGGSSEMGKWVVQGRREGQKFLRKENSQEGGGGVERAVGTPRTEEINKGSAIRGVEVMLLGISPLRLSTAKRNREPWGVGGGQRGGEVRKVEGRQKDRGQGPGSSRRASSSRQPPYLHSALCQHPAPSPGTPTPSLTAPSGCPICWAFL